MTNVSTSIKILLSNLVVAALVATYLTSGGKNDSSTVGLKGARQLQTFAGDFNNFPISAGAKDFISSLSSGTFSNINFTQNNFLDQVTFTPSPNVGSFFDQVNANNLNFTSSNVPGQAISFFDQVNINNLNFTSSNVPGQPISFFDQVNANNANFTSSSIPTVGNFISTLNFTSGNLIGPGGTDFLDIISGNVGKLPPAQSFIQFPAP
jgi:hypothetical protein